MHVVICEDDLIFQQSTTNHVNQWADRRGCPIKISVFSSSEEFAEKWKKGLKCDIILLDILFDHEMDGMKIAKMIRNTDLLLPIVFITSSDAYIHEGYRIQALRYLNKPIHSEDIDECMDIAYNRYTLTQNGYLILEVYGGRYAIPKNEIIFIEAIAPRVRIICAGQKKAIELRYRFRDIVARLSSEPMFLLCHRSILVNLIHIRNIWKSELHLSNGSEVPLSRTYVESITNAFDQFYQEGGNWLHVDSV